MIKILYIINDFENISLNRNAFKIAASLPRDKFTAYILALSNNGSLKDSFFTTFRHRSFISDKSFFYGVSQTANTIRNFGVKIVHTQTLRADYTLFLAKMLNWFQKSFRGRQRRPWESLSGSDCHDVTRLAMTKRTRIFHVANRRNYLFLACEPNFLFKNILYFVSCHLADFNICVARHLRQKLVTRLMVPGSKIAVIPNGINPLNIVGKENTISNPPLITYTGQLVKRKNLILLLRALAKVTYPFRCLIIGAGPEKQKLEEFAQTQKLGSKVRFQPFTSNISRFLAKTDIFVLPSLAEGMSMSLLEAMSFGIACIVSSIDANTELITHMKNGLIVPKTQTKVLAGYLDLLLKDSKLRQKLGMNAYRKIKDNYEIKKMLWRYQELYTRVSMSNFNSANLYLTLSFPEY